MKVNVVRIGNSRGIRIPKPLLEQCHIGNTVELEVRGDHLVLRPADRARAGWEEAFRRMADEGDDALIDREAWPVARWDQTEWHW